MAQSTALRLALDPSDPTPIYAQLERALLAAMADGRLGPGAQLPTVRRLAVDLAVNANTVARVYATLERTGVVETRRGVGTFVAALQPPTVGVRERDRRLRVAVDRLLADTAALGVTIDEIIAHLRARRG
jgi:GntR family transcriptional regulator